MVEKIEVNGKILAIIISASYSTKGIEFFTPNSFSQQLGYMNREAGYKIEPHYHKVLERKVILTQEVLYVKSGKVRVDFFDDQKKYFESRVISTGDVILLAEGGHGFEFLENAEMIEVKQGPYAGQDDKVRFS
jgi:mannose-6-phosphate isomerase-like protein (cupin superfamily)